MALSATWSIAIKALFTALISMILKKRLLEYVLNKYFEERFRQGGNFEISCFDDTGNEQEESGNGNSAVVDLLFSEPVVEAFFNDKELTPREINTMNYILKGFTYRTAATNFCSSPGTVKKHWFNALEKLPVKNKSELMNFLIDLRDNRKPGTNPEP